MSEHGERSALTQSYHNRCATKLRKIMVNDAVQLIVELVEADIPRARLSEPFSSHTIPALRKWLLCRGVTFPTGWKKQQILSR